MPTIDEAIERAAIAVHNAIHGTDLDPFENPEAWDFSVNIAKAALSALLADVPVSEGMIRAGERALNDEGVDNVKSTDAVAAFKAMSAKLAEEIRNV